MIRFIKELGWGAGIVAVAIALWLAIFSVLTGCSGASTRDYTWGDASEEFAVAYCEAAEACGYNIDVELCVEHTRWHLCEAERDCNVEVAFDEVPAALAACIEAFGELDEDGCFLLSWGVVPAECGEFLDLKSTDHRTDDGGSS